MVKICGLTRAEDVRKAVGLGASYLGFNFARQSPRRLDPEAAPAVAGASGERVPRVGVFVDEDAGYVSRCIQAAGLNCLQFHRSLTESDFGFGLPVIGVSLVWEDGPRWPAPELLRRCHALLFDTGGTGHPGGTGKAFAWHLLAGRETPVPLWLAGGLNASNVADAIRAVRPALVDVASGVESAPGVKSPERMEQFVRAVRRADDNE